MRLMSLTYQDALPPERAFKKLNLLSVKLSSFIWKASKQMVFLFLPLVAKSNTSTSLPELPKSANLRWRSANFIFQISYLKYMKSKV